MKDYKEQNQQKGKKKIKLKRSTPQIGPLKKMINEARLILKNRGRKR